MMFSRSTLAALAVASVTLCMGTASSSLAGTKAVQSAIVVPARHAYLQLAVDVSRFQSVTVIGFRKSQAGVVRLFVWDESKKGWSRLAVEDYQSGAVFGGKATRLVLVNADETIPPVLETLSPAITETEVISTSSIGDLLNKFSPIFKLTESQFRSIAGWNNLTLTDHNADRRKYGRWGKPGGSTEESQAPMEVHQGQQVSAPKPQAAPATEYVEPEETEPVSVNQAAAPASELPVANVVSEQPEAAAVDPANK